MGAFGRGDGEKSRGITKGNEETFESDEYFH